MSLVLLSWKRYLYDEMNVSGINSSYLRRLFMLLTGPLLFYILQLPDFEGMTAQGQIVLAATAWIGFWWITEVVPVAVTALLPLIVFPVAGVMGFDKAAEEFANEIIFLFLGSFFIGAAIQKWGLHQRFAIYMLSFTGMNSKTLLLAFMGATAFISMWISNTATTAMMLPIGLAFASKFEDIGDQKTSKSLLLAIAYAAGIGGMAKPVGSPTNAILLNTMQEYFQTKIGFIEWIKVALPISVVLLLAA